MGKPFAEYLFFTFYPTLVFNFVRIKWKIEKSEHLQYVEFEHDTFVIGRCEPFVRIFLFLDGKYL